MTDIIAGNILIFSQTIWELNMGWDDYGVIRAARIGLQIGLSNQRQRRYEEERARNNAEWKDYWSRINAQRDAERARLYAARGAVIAADREMARCTREAALAAQQHSRNLKEAAERAHRYAQSQNQAREAAAAVERDKVTRLEIERLRAEVTALRTAQRCAAETIAKADPAYARNFFAEKKANGPRVMATREDRLLFEKV